VCVHGSLQSHRGTPGLCWGGEGSEAEAPLDGREVAKSVFGIVGGVTMVGNECLDWITQNFEVDWAKWQLQQLSQPMC